MYILDVFTYTGKNCITRTDGDKIYNLIYPDLLAGKTIQLNFEGVEIYASPFFNAAIGRLLKDIKKEVIDENLKLVNIKQVGQETFELVKSNSSQYYNDHSFRKSLDAVLNDEEEDN